MAECTGRMCPMQVGYKVDECNHKDCRYRTEPITNTDRIRAMRDEGLAEMLTVGKGTFSCLECRGIGDGECSMQCDERCLEWLQQPAEGE